MAEDGLCRETINSATSIVKRIIKWAVARELVAPSVYQAIACASGLRQGRTTAPDLPPVEPVPDEVIDRTIPYLPPIVADMVLLQRATGCRPSEDCAVRPCDIDRTADVWVYRPESHKMEHHGRERIVFLGPKAQAILRPYVLGRARAVGPRGRTR